MKIRNPFRRPGVRRLDFRSPVFVKPTWPGLDEMTWENILTLVEAKSAEGDETVTVLLDALDHSGNIERHEWIWEHMSPAATDFASRTVSQDMNHGWVHRSRI